MQFIQGKNRTQSILFPQSLDQIIEQDNEVRIIDLFVESINLADFKFIIKDYQRRAACLSSQRSIKAFCVWLSQSHPFKPAIGKRMQTQH